MKPILPALVASSFAMPFLTAPLLTSCNLVHGCTDAGCGEAVQMTFSTQLPVGEYQVEVTTPEGAGSCQLTVLNGTSRQACEGAGPMFRVHAGGVFLDDTPTSVSLRLTSAGTLIAEATMTPEYENFFPNGTDCPPVCQVAELEIAVDLD